MLEDLYHNYTDFVLRSVVADWCEDNEKYKMAEFLRWMITEKKRPMDEEGTFIWFNKDKILPGMYDEESDLPEALFLKLKVGVLSANHRSYKTVKEAEEDLYQAWQE